MNLNNKKYMLKKITIAIMLLTITSFSQALDNNIDSITWMSENFPPYNYTDEKGLAAGLSIEIVKGILEQSNSKKTVNDIEILPWARAYQELLNNKNYALFSTIRIPQRESLFKWVGPLRNSRIFIFSKKHRAIKIRSAEDLKKYTIGAESTDAALQLINNIAPGLKMELTSNLEEGVKKLNANHIDLLAGDKNVVEYLITKNKLDLNDYESVYTLKEISYWIAFNKDTSDELVKLIQTSFDNIKH